MLQIFGHEFFRGNEEERCMIHIPLDETYHLAIRGGSGSGTFSFDLALAVPSST